MPRKVPTIDFSAIRPLAGASRKEGFEELAVMMFREEMKDQGTFYRVEGAGGDGGVEAYVEHEDGSVVGFQSKYFEKLTDTQWRQVTKSVTSALKNHPGLKKYVVAVPKNRTPAQIQKWKSLTEEWKVLGETLGRKRAVKFEWQGYSELSKELTKDKFRNYLSYWFGTPKFSASWIHERNTVSVTQLEKRYSPELHINTASGRKLEAFAESDSTRVAILDSYVGVVKRWAKLAPGFGRRPLPSPEASKAHKLLVSLMSKIDGFRWPERRFPAIAPLLRNVGEAMEVTYDLRQALDRYDTERESLPPGEREKTEKYEFTAYSLRELGDNFYALKTTLERCIYADSKEVLVCGEAGNGKSHLIAELVRLATDRNQIALHLLGEAFLDSSEPWHQLVENIGWNYEPEDLLAALDQEAILRGRPSLLCIDALNESDNRNLWKNHILSFSARLKDFSNVKLIISCRSDFLPITLPEIIWGDHKKGWAVIDHEGYGSEVVEAVAMYFKEFDVRARYFPPVLEEFSNPLFLRTFCEAFVGKEVPEGPITLSNVMKARIEQLCVQIQKEIDCDPSDTQAALKAITELIARNGGKAVDREEARTLINQYSPSKNSYSSLYLRLRSNGILVEQIAYSKPGSDPAVRVRFPFERFCDFLVARGILEGVSSSEELIALFKAGGTLEHLLDPSSYWDNRGVARALAILVPEKIGIELASFIPKGKFHDAILEDFLASFPWRAPGSFSDNTKKFLKAATYDGYDVIGTHLRVATIPGHPYNAKHLSERLIGLRLVDRDLMWTIPIADESARYDGGLPSRIVDWCFKVPSDLISDQQAELVGHLLLWFCSSNHRALRRRSSIAAIKILRGRPVVVTKLLRAFSTVNDPYVAEKLFAITAGVVVREQASKSLTELGRVVYEQVFSPEWTSPNIAIRDYATTTLETLAVKNCLPEGIDSASFRPPFKSKWPRIANDVWVDKLENNEKWGEIFSSVRTESMGHYGDFGRYVMGTAVHSFSDLKKSRPKPSPGYRGTFRAAIARRWVLQRIKQLGWTPADFAEYESKLPFQGRQRHDVEKMRLERISKKYQWIALRELQGYLTDHYWLAPSWGDERPDYRGAWQIWGRDFDPSQRLIDPLASPQADDEESSDRPWLGGYPDPFKDDRLCIDREKWVTMRPAEFSVLLEPEGTSSKSHRWLTLAGHYAWQEPKYDLLRRESKGKLKMWADIRTYLVPKAQLKSFVTRLQGRNFWGHGIDLPEEHDAWIGEYPWSPSYDTLKEQCQGPDRMIGKIDIPYEYAVCRWPGGEGANIPSPGLVKALDLEWSGDGATFRNKSGEIVFSHVSENSWANPCVIRYDSLQAGLAKAGLAIVWCVVAERSCWCSETTTHIVKKEGQISSIYYLSRGKISGGISNFHIFDFGRRSTN